jgi:hypothetical protein
MKIGRWYDPISERWFEPRNVAYVPDFQQGAKNPPDRNEDQLIEEQRIWQLLVDCCARD